MRALTLLCNCYSLLLAHMTNRCGILYDVLRIGDRTVNKEDSDPVFSEILYSIPIEKFGETNISITNKW